VPATEAEWLQRIEGKSIREIEPIVSGYEKGDKPGKEKDPRKTPKRVMLAFKQEKFERFMRCVESNRKTCDVFLEIEDAVLADLEEQDSERSGDGSHPRNQILYT